MSFSGLEYFYVTDNRRFEFVQGPIIYKSCDEKILETVMILAREQTRETCDDEWIYHKIQEVGTLTLNVKN